jgi:uncharacterized OB-fold protein
MNQPSNDRGHNAPCSNLDFDFFYAGLEQQRLLVQKCWGCGMMRNPPAPACPSCQSLAWEAFPLSGRGSVFSFTIHYHPPLPGFAMPHPIVLADMAESIRMVGAMDGVDPDAVKVGMAVDVEFVRRGDVAGFRFIATGESQ